MTGAVAGAASRTIVSPLERLKIIMFAFDTSISLLADAGDCRGQAMPRHRSAIQRCMEWSCEDVAAGRLVRQLHSLVRHALTFEQERLHAR